MDTENPRMPIIKFLKLVAVGDIFDNEGLISESGRYPSGEFLNIIENKHEDQLLKITALEMISARKDKAIFTALFDISNQENLADEFIVMCKNALIKRIGQLDYNGLMRCLHHKQKSVRSAVFNMLRKQEESDANTSLLEAIINSAQDPDLSLKTIEVLGSRSLKFKFEPLVKLLSDVNLGKAAKTALLDPDTDELDSKLLHCLMKSDNRQAVDEIIESILIEKFKKWNLLKKMETFDIEIGWDKKNADIALNFFEKATEIIKKKIKNPKTSTEKLYKIFIMGDVVLKGESLKRLTGRKNAEAFLIKIAETDNNSRYWKPALEALKDLMSPEEIKFQFLY